MKKLTYDQVYEKMTKKYLLGDLKYQKWPGKDADIMKAVESIVDSINDRISDWENETIVKNNNTPFKVALNTPFDI